MGTVGMDKSTSVQVYWAWVCPSSLVACSGTLELSLQIPVGLSA